MINVLGADVKTGSVFCLDCDDIITDETFEDLYRATTLHIEEKETQFICMLSIFFKFQKISNLLINQLLSPAQTPRNLQTLDTRAKGRGCSCKYIYYRLYRYVPAIPRWVAQPLPKIKSLYNYSSFRRTDWTLEHGSNVFLERCTSITPT